MLRRLGEKKRQGGTKEHAESNKGVPSILYLVDPGILLYLDDLFFCFMLATPNMRATKMFVLIVLYRL